MQGPECPLTIPGNVGSQDANPLPESATSRESALPDIPPDVDPYLLDEDGKIKSDVPCDNCRYNLRTLHHGGRCPECGPGVAPSLAYHWLRAGPAAYLQKLRAGAILIAASHALLIPGAIWAIAAGATWPDGTWQRNYLAERISIVVGGVSILTYAAGAALLTTRSPHYRHRREGRGVRKMARASGLVITGLLAAAFLTAGGSGPIEVPVCALLLAVAFYPFLILAHACDIATQIPQRRSLARLRVVFRGDTVGEGQR